MTENKLLSILKLQATPLVGDVTAKRLIKHCGSAEAIFKEKTTALNKIEGIGAVIVNNLRNKKYHQLAAKELEYIQKNNIAYWYFEDAAYPERLKQCLDGPILIFRSGNIDINNKKIISLVGTRQISSYGMSFCEQFIEEIAVLNPIIVSGFAYGVDITAQKAAIKNGLQTIGCLAHGLNQIYPKSHKRYCEQVEQNGGFITDFWSTSQPERENFLKRNRIIAGLSEATIVIESAAKGGSLVTADIANSYHKEVFAVPGRATDTYSLGCNNLIKSQKAHLLTSAADLIYMLDWNIEPTKEKVIQKQLFVELNNTEQVIYDFLKVNGKEWLDRISIQCKIPVHKAATILLTMELKGVVRPLPGKLFEIV